MASANGQPMSGSNHIRSSGDVDGNRWCGWASGEGLDGVMVFNKGRELIGRTDLPERCANVCFGGIAGAVCSRRQAGRCMRFGSAPQAGEASACKCSPFQHEGNFFEIGSHVLILSHRKLSCCCQKRW